MELNTTRDPDSPKLPAPNLVQVASDRTVKITDGETREITHTTIDEQAALQR